MSPEKEKQFETSESAIDWYRSLGQDASMYGETENLVQGAKLIIERNPGGYRKQDKETGEIIDPFILDAACMILEAARTSTSEDNKHNYQNAARGILQSIAKNESLSMSSRLDAKMYLSDSYFAELYEDYYSENIEYTEFEKKWRSTHLSALESFQETVDELEGADDYSLGKVFEWFWMHSSRQIQFENNDSLGIDRWLIRAAYLREDKAYEKRLDDISGNFDVSYDEFINSRWASTGQVQLSNRHKSLRYREPIQPLTYIFDMPNGRASEMMNRQIQVMKKEIMATADDRITLSHFDREELKANRELIESGYTNN